MFDQLKMAPPDPILGIQEVFDRDPHPGKVNLSIGVYKDDTGKTPILRSVKTAEERLLAGETNKSYLAIVGTPRYAGAVQELLFGANSDIAASGRAVSAQAPGGTGGLRVAADLLADANRQATVWLSKPTWPNHANVFGAAGLAVQSYPYFDPATNGLAFGAMLETLGGLKSGDVVVLHGCCHNPTGIDPTPAQWAELAATLHERGALPLIDFAYQGFGDGLQEDAVGVRTLAASMPELLIASSYSKNFGLYNERVGALTFIGSSREVAQVTLSHIKCVIRANYSNPPAHGAAIVTTILADPTLRTQWEEELSEMRGRIHAMRRSFVETLKSLGVPGDFSYIERQRGMFSFSGLNRDQVRRLREEHSVHIIDSGRINVAGLTADNIDRVCRAIAAVV